MNQPLAPCPLCGCQRITRYHEDRERAYLQCPTCTLVFVPSRFWLSPEAEKAEYDLHRNEILDEGYRRFLSRLSQPLLQRLEKNRYGLDFGCGPGPALATLLEEAGHQVELYDPFYAPNDAVFDRQYDFICATEVIEHLRQPGQELARLWGILRPGGCLALMTKLVLDRERFRTWHYIRDRTHLCFFSRDTFYYLANRFDAELEILGNDVILLHKQAPGPD